MTPTEHQNAVMRAFVDCVVAGLNPSLRAYSKPHNGEAEYDLLVGGRSTGIIQEDIETVLRIATTNGGRAFIHHAEERCGNCFTHIATGDSCLSIVWPGRTPDGPDPEGEHDAQAAKGKRKPRKTAAS